MTRAQHHHIVWNIFFTECLNYQHGKSLIQDWLKLRVLIPNKVTVAVRETSNFGNTDLESLKGENYNYKEKGHISSPTYIPKPREGERERGNSKEFFIEDEETKMQ